MTCGDERVDAHSAAHDVIAYSVDEWVWRFRFRETHVRVANRSQSCVEEEFLVEKV
jgi:hypothetical protein